MMGNRNRGIGKRLLSLITHHSSLITLLITLFCLVLASCEREERGFRVEPPSSSRVNTIRLTEFQAGTTQPPQVTTNEYEKNAYAVSEGKRLYEQMNCVGCYFHGGGGIGPPLMESRSEEHTSELQSQSNLVCRLLLEKKKKKKKKDTQQIEKN